MVVSAMWDIGERDKEVKLEMNDRRKKRWDESSGIGTWVAGLISYSPMGRERAVPFILNLLIWYIE